MEEKLGGPGRSQIFLEPVSGETAELYCRLGEQAYRDHYLHLWPRKDPSPYIHTSFTPRVVQSEMTEQDNLHFILRFGVDAIGIAKLILNRNPKGLEFPAPVYLEKIYLLKDHTGMGIGEQVILALHTLSRKRGMGYIYLATMQKGRALSFYLKMGYEILRKETLPFENAIPEEKGMFLLGRNLE
ncbi:GNAT family N-acetyltransferase [Muriicola jejuensis]|nr:GNAT family N-acetyltransferase [Muriicola jejuensis]